MTTNERLKTVESEYKIAKREYETMDLSFRHDITKEIEEYTDSLRIKSSRLKQIEDSLLYTKIISPINGVIQEKKELNKNDWIQAGESLFNVIPIEDKSNKVELYVPARQAGKIRVGMKVKLKFPSLPYHEFGDCEGIINAIKHFNIMFSEK